VDNAIVWVALVDVTGDGRLDLIASGGAKVTVMKGKGDGTFGLLAHYTAGSNLTWLAVADLNHDAIPDIVASDRAADTASVLLGEGHGAFGRANSYPAGVGPAQLAVGDVTGDGAPDIVVADVGPNDASTVATLPGHGDGTFGGAVLYGTATQATCLAIGGFDGPLPDDVVTQNLRTVAVLLNAAGEGGGVTSAGRAGRLNPTVG
jgi:hypothetical protein